MKRMKNYLILLLLVASQTLYAQNCLNGWDWYQPMTVHNTGNVALTECQIRFDFNTGALVSDNKLLNDGADFRITDGSCNLVPYFMDSLASDSMNSIWVKLSIPANDSMELQLYYGNETAETVASGDSVFIFFDDFSADTVNPDKWEAIGGYAKFQTAGGILEYASDGMNPGPRFKFARTKMSFQDKVHFDYRARISNSNGIGFSSADSTITRILFRQSSFGFDTLNQVAFMKDTVSNGFQVNGLYPIIRFPRNEFRNATIRAAIEDTMLTMDYFANLDENSVSDSVYQLVQEKMSGFHFIVSSFLGTQTIYLDYLRVRKPSPENVSINFGEEEALVSDGIFELAHKLHFGISPNPARESVRILGLETGVYHISVANSLGQKLFSEEFRSLDSQQVDVNLAQLPVGYYWLSISDQAGKIGTRALVIEK